MKERITIENKIFIPRESYSNVPMNEGNNPGEEEIVFHFEFSRKIFIPKKLKNEPDGDAQQSDEQYLQEITFY